MIELRFLSQFYALGAKNQAQHSLCSFEILTEYVFYYLLQDESVMQLNNNLKLFINEIIHGTKTILTQKYYTMNKFLQDHFKNQKSKSMSQDNYRRLAHILRM